MEGWLADRGYAVSKTAFFDEDYRLPEIAAVDLLIIMGGPMSVNDGTEYPWLAAEKAFIADFIDAGKPVLGVCLGAQLIASALGAKVYPNGEAEIGWFPVFGTRHPDAGIFPIPDEQMAFHWHGETFDLPPGAIHLARSHGCENQGFQWGRNVIGLQFHLETTPDSAQALVRHSGDELVVGDFIQSPGQILFPPDDHYAAIHRLMAGVLAFITGS